MSITHVSAIDPQNRTGKIRIPLNLCFDTKGKLDAVRTEGKKDLSLCLLFQRGKCNAGGKCHQIHADCEYVAQLRVEAAQNDSCCASHGDAHSKEIIAMPARTVLYMTPTRVHIPVSIHCFAATQGLESILHSGSELRVAHNKVCRLQQEGRCKYGRDCKNVHMCRTKVAELSSAVQAVQGPKTQTPTETSHFAPAKTGSPAPQKQRQHQRVSSTRCAVVSPVPVAEEAKVSPRDNATLAQSQQHDTSSCGSDTNSTEHSATTGDVEVSPQPPTSRVPTSRVVTPPPALCPELLTSETGSQNTPAPLSVLDEYLKGWHSSCRSSVRDSPLFVAGSRTPLDLRLLCTDILGM